jgi:HEXXH motif-containing protein
VPARDAESPPGHRIPAPVLDELFSGPVSATVVALLRAGQHSRRLLLLKELRDHTAQDAAWRVLVDADRRAPEVVRDILASPSVGVWLTRAIRRLRGTVDDESASVDLGGLAAAAAMRAGCDAVVDVPVVNGWVNLPSIGLLRVAAEDGTVRLRIADSAAYTESGTRAALDVWALREHRSTSGGRSVRWIVDDVDPYRTFDTPEAPARLDAAEFAIWCARLDDAWEHLVTVHPAHVPEVAAIEPVVVPVPPRAGLVATSSAAAFGAFCLTPPASAAALAETVVHELQHSKLNALLDLVPLQKPGADRLCYAPWRRDPRPLGGLLHGIYAFTGVAEFWRARWSRTQAPQAAFMAVQHREQVRAALTWLGAAPELTDLGTRFLAAATARLAACDDIPVADDVAAVIALLGAENRLAWRLRHLRPPEAPVAELVRRWHAGEPAPEDVDGGVPEPDHRREVPSRLASLLTMRARDPRRFAASPHSARPGELELARGRHAEAADLFAARLRQNGDDDAAWTGLLLAAHAGHLPPETVVATCQRLGEPADPRRIVDWFVHR